MQLSTGLIIAAAFADKIRRVVFAQLRDEIKKGTISSETVVRRTAELNRLLYDIIVNRLKMDKLDAVRIRIEYDVRDGDIVWKLDTLRIEAYRRVPEEEVRKAIEETIRTAKEVLAAPVTAEEREWLEAEKVREEAVEEAWKPSPDVIAQTVFVGEREGGGRLALIRNSRDESVGMAVLKPTDHGTEVLAVLIPSSREAYQAKTTTDKPYEEISESELRDILLKARYTRISVEEAQRIIKEEREKVV